MTRLKGRCEECGAFVHEHKAYPEMERCPVGAHADATVIPWTNGTIGQSMRIAYHLICRAASFGRNLDRYVETAPESDLNGTSRADLAYALLLARKWQRETEFSERALPVVTSPAGLFG